MPVSSARASRARCSRAATWSTTADAPHLLATVLVARGEFSARYRFHYIAAEDTLELFRGARELIDALPRNAFLKVVKPLLRQRFNS